jgi:hypothetical protein
MAAQIAVHISSGARRRSSSGTPMNRGSSARSHKGPGIIAVPIKPGGDPHAAMAISPAATIPIPVSAIWMSATRAGSPPANRRTACMSSTLAACQGMRIRPESTRIQTCD